MPSTSSEIISNDVVRNIIRSADLDRLRAVLDTVCSELPEAKRIVERELVAEVASDTDGDNDTEEEPEGEEEATAEREPARSSGPKRQRARYALCLNCREEYDVTDNDRESCTYHDGEIEPDYDNGFVDHDPDCHGDPDGDWCKEEYPDCYIWSCCEALGIDSEGCRTGKHKEDTKYVPGSKKPRLWE